MAFVKTIYFPDNLRQDLDKVDNVSNLVSKLLNEHFQKGKIDCDIDNEINKFRSKAELLMEQLKKEEDDLRYQKETVEKEREEEESLLQTSKDKEQRFIESVIKNAKELFNAEITEENVKDFRKHSDYVNLLDYLVAKGFVNKEDY